MVLESKGQIQILYFAMVCIAVIVLAIALAYPTYEVSTDAQTDMNCTGTDNKFTQAGCTATDLTPAFYIGGAIAIAGIVLAAKGVFG